MSNEIVRYGDVHPEAPLARRGPSAIVKAVNWIFYRGRQKPSIDIKFTERESEDRGVPLLPGPVSNTRAAEPEEDSHTRYVRSESPSPLEDVTGYRVNPRPVRVDISWSGETPDYSESSSVSRRNQHPTATAGQQAGAQPISPSQATQPTTPPRKKIKFWQRVSSFPSAHPWRLTGLIAGLAVATGYYFLRGDGSTPSSTQSVQASAGFGSGIDNFVGGSTDNSEKPFYSGRINLFDDVNNDGLPDDPKKQDKFSVRYFENPLENRVVLEGATGKYVIVDSEDKINVGVSDRARLSDIGVEFVTHGARHYNRDDVLSSGTLEERKEFDRLGKMYRTVVKYIRSEKEK